MSPVAACFGDRRNGLAWFGLCATSASVSPLTVGVPGAAGGVVQMATGTPARVGAASAKIEILDAESGKEPDAAAEGMSLNERDHGCGAGVDRVEHSPERVGVGDVLVVGKVDRSPHPLDVGAGAEARPFAGEHDGTHLADVDECFCELFDQGRIEGVSRFGAAEGDPEDVVIPLDAQRVHCTAV